MTIGVLAIQGDYEAHKKRLEELGAAVVLVRKPEELKGLDGLVLPGGESTTMLKFLERGDFFERIRRYAENHPVFGTCAGAILLAKEVTGPPQKSLGAMDITVERNAYGRQLDSAIEASSSTVPGAPLEMVFIRAPRITRTGKDVEVLAKRGDDPVLVRQGKRMAATFHPELSADTRVHAEFLSLVKRAT